MFLVHLGIILGYVVSEEGKLSNSEKKSTIVHMATMKTPKDIKVFNGMAQYYRCFIKDFFSHYGSHYQGIAKDKSF
jgi:hypothetical protein